MKKEFYRVANNITGQGLWYDQLGNFTGLIHDKFNFCMNKDLPMPFDKEIVGWLSVTDVYDNLFLWFSKEDILKLQEHGYSITVYEAEKYKEYQNHHIICQQTSKMIKQISLC